jgi:hypothetical protein
MNKSKTKEECINSICRFPLLYAESGLMPKEIVKNSRNRRGNRFVMFEG